jgi:hypothetical protein
VAKVGDVFEYVIVGGGSAGCVLAARLAEDPGVRVLLLEAGPDPDAEEIRIPAAYSRLFQSRYDWNFVTLPQERADGRAIYWPRGRVLGGSSALNAISAATRATMTRGAMSSAAPAGDTVNCSRISCAPRTTRAGRARITEREDRSPFRICVTNPNTGGTSSPPPAVAGQWRTTTSTDPSRMGLASSRSPSVMGAGAASRTPTWHISRKT